ncbi:MAG: 6,7-dimethyl-8-ribityllumazine synthase [Acidobacteriota bacterium]
MTYILEGKPRGEGLRLAVVVSRFNSFVTDKLLEGALEALQRSGVASADVHVARVPGSFEIPLTARKLAASGRYDGVVCLGAIIRGETPHWGYLAEAVAHALAQAALQTGIPLSFGVLTTETREAALARAGARGDNKGYDAAMAAVEMANLYRQMDGS